MSRRLQTSDVLRITVPEEITIHPTGDHVVFVHRGPAKDADRDDRSLWLLPRTASAPRQLTAGPFEGSPRWSPDGSRLAFLRSDDEHSPAQLWSLDPADGSTSPLTTLPLGAGPGTWSPDGSHLAFCAPVVTDHRSDRPTDESHLPVVSRRLDNLADGRPPLDRTRRHLHVLEFATGTVTVLTSGDWEASEAAWSPDGRRLVFTAAAEDDSDLTFEISAYVLDLDDPGSKRRIGPTGARLAEPSWHPDGRSILASGRTDSATGLTQLLRIDVTDGSVTVLPTGDRSVALGGNGAGGRPAFTRDGSGVLFARRDGGGTPLCHLDLTTGDLDILTGADEAVLDIAATGGDQLAVVLATPENFGEVVFVDLRSSELTRGTALQHETLPDVDLFIRSARTFPTTDGTEVSGWTLTDPAIDGPKPLLVDLHGGPHSVWGAYADRFHLYHQVLAAHGWIVLTLNPRASEGYGEDFLTAALGRWGEADCGDILEPIDVLVAEGLADPGRLTVAGHSYGGYLAAYLTAHDSRFAAAAVSAPITDLVGMIGTSDVGSYLGQREFGPTVTTATLRRLSPLDRVDQVSTPTLLLHGGDDLRCPVGQSQQWFAGLRRRGTPVEYVRYPGADHALASASRPSHRLDVNERIVAWLREHTAETRHTADAVSQTEQWQRLLSQLLATHDVPGAVLGVLRLTEDGADETSVVAAGVLNIDTAEPVRADSIFQIGSITKVWTAALIHQLQDEGLLDLDDRLAEILPDLELSEPGLADRITVRDLLRHTSGIDGDLYFDTGRGSESISRLVDRLREVPQLFPPGQSWSYSNTGYVLAAHIIERLTGVSWDEAVRRRLVDRLGLRATVTFPEDVLLHSSALGHVDLDQGRVTAPIWGLPRSLAPAGVINSSAADLLAFARMLLADGADPTGNQVLSTRAVTEMRTEQARVPDIFAGSDAWGAGLILTPGYDRPLIGHDGGMIGQSSFLRMIPGDGVAVVLLTNGGHGDALFDQLFHAIGTRLTGLRRLPVADRSAAPARAEDRSELDRYTGSYRREGKIIEVTPAETGLRVSVTSTVELIKMIGRSERVFDLEPVRPGLFTARDEKGAAAGQIAFLLLESGRMLMHMGLRATPRVSS